MIFSAARTQVRTETRASGNYSASVRVVTASYGGFGGDPAWKLRVLLVRGDRPEDKLSPYRAMPRSGSGRPLRG